MKRLRNIFFVVLALIYSLFRVSAKKPSNRMRFMVVQPTGNLGDAVCVTPILDAIKKHNPLAEVTFIGQEKIRPLLEDHPSIDDYIILPASIWRFISILRNKKYDVGITLDFNPAHIAALLLGNVQEISCLILSGKYKKKIPPPYRIISWLTHQVEHHPGNYVPQECLGLLSPFGINEGSATKTLAYSEELLSTVSKKMYQFGIQPEQRVVVIAPGAGAPYKCWPANRFGAVANYLHKELSIPTIVVGGAGDQEYVKLMVDSIAEGVCFWSPGPQSLEDLKATLRRASLVIGNDSGAIHVGEALGVKTLTIAGPTDVGEHMKEDDRHRIVKGLRSENVYQSYVGDEAAVDQEYAGKQMESVTVEEVLSVVTRLLENE